MMQISMADLRERVLVSRERVKFADADPYGHLASGAYVDLIMSHRVEVLADLLGFSIMRQSDSGVLFPARNVSVSYLRPAFVGNALEVGSWVAALGTSSFEVRAVVSGVEDRRARAVATVHFVAVDASTGRSVPRPETLPSTLAADPVGGLPRLVDYLAEISGIPDEWRPVTADRS